MFSTKKSIKVEFQMYNLHFNIICSIQSKICTNLLFLLSLVFQYIAFTINCNKKNLSLKLIKGASFGDYLVWQWFYHYQVELS